MNLAFENVEKLEKWRSKLVIESKRVTLKKDIKNKVEEIEKEAGGATEGGEDTEDSGKKPLKPIVRPSYIAKI